MSSSDTVDPAFPADAWQLIALRMPIGGPGSAAALAIGSATEERVAYPSQTIVVRGLSEEQKDWVTQAAQDLEGEAAHVGVCDRCRMHTLLYWHGFPDFSLFLCNECSRNY